MDSAQHNVDKHHNLNLQSSFVSIDDNEGEENHPRSVIEVDAIQSTSDRHNVNPHNNTTDGDRLGSNQTRESIRNTVRSQESEQVIVIIEDSIIKHISPTKLSKRKVHKIYISWKNSIRCKQ